MRLLTFTRSLSLSLRELIDLKSSPSSFKRKDVHLHETAIILFSYRWLRFRFKFVAFNRTQSNSIERLFIGIWINNNKSNCFFFLLFLFCEREIQLVCCSNSFVVLSYTSFKRVDNGMLTQILASNKPLNPFFAFSFCSFLFIHWFRQANWLN